MYPNCSSAFTPFLVHALHPYRHSSSDSTSTHLAFDKHQAILVITKHTSGWWDGELADGKRGWFPGHYVELAKTDEHEGGERGRDGESMEGRAEDAALRIASGMVRSDTMESVMSDTAGVAGLAIIGVAVLKRI